GSRSTVSGSRGCRRHLARQPQQEGQRRRHPPNGGRPRNPPNLRRRSRSRNFGRAGRRGGHPPPEAFLAWSWLLPFPLRKLSSGLSHQVARRSQHKPFDVLNELFRQVGQRPLAGPGHVRRDDKVVEFSLSRGLSGEGGSVSRESIPAPPMRPSASASASANS